MNTSESLRLKVKIISGMDLVYEHTYNTNEHIYSFGRNDCCRHTTCCHVAVAGICNSPYITNHTEVSLCRSMDRTFGDKPKDWRFNSSWGNIDG